MIPRFGPTGKLPRGEHRASWEELEKRFSFSARRKTLLAGLLKGCRELKALGVKTVWVDGSFATAKRVPGDFDCCYDLTGIDWDKMPEPFSKLDPPRAEQKAAYGGEFFPAHFTTGNPPEPFSTFFQHDKADRPKGIIILDLDTLP